MQNILDTLSRKSTATQATPERHTPVRAVAENLSRRNEAQAKCELLNETLSRLTDLVYETDQSGYLCNADHITGRILVPMPCGRAGYKQWGLYPSERDVLRMALLHWADKARRAPLYTYCPSETRWFLNIFDYPDIDTARFWLSRTSVTVPLWREIFERLPHRRRV